MNEVKIQYAEEKLIPSFHKLLDAVAKEKIYLEILEARPLDQVMAFQKGLIEKNLPVYYAVSDDQVVGWIDITRFGNPRMAHRGGLGMGVHKDLRGQGIGKRLLEAALAHAKDVGLEKVELQVYTDNGPAIKLYDNAGFERVGVIKSFRKLDGQYFDALMMERFL